VAALRVQAAWRLLQANMVAGDIFLAWPAAALEDELPGGTGRKADELGAVALRIHLLFLFAAGVRLALPCRTCCCLLRPLDVA